MVNLKNQRRMAANLLGCGENRVWINENRLEDVAGAVTRSDVRRLIVSRAIQKKAVKGISRARIIHKKKQKQKGRRKGIGSRKGGVNARYPKKRKWIKIIRPIRTRLRELKSAGAIDVKSYRQLYRQANGGMFRSKAHIEAQIRARGLLNEEALKKVADGAKKLVKKTKGTTVGAKKKVKKVVKKVKKTVDKEE